MILNKGENKMKKKTQKTKKTKDVDVSLYDGSGWFAFHSFRVPQEWTEQEIADWASREIEPEALDWHLADENCCPGDIEEAVIEGATDDDGGDVDFDATV